jgi:galactose mutarotase-like enzyme
LVFNQPFPTLSDKKPQVILISPDDKIRLTFSSNQSSVQVSHPSSLLFLPSWFSLLQQVYTAKYFDGKGSRKEFHTTGSPSDGYTKFQAVFLEFQQVIGACLPGKDKLVDAAGGDDTILKPGQIYENWVETEVEVFP